ncbi:hypothetical protein C8J57DRAFT_1384738 [Mycena rebaudengoi]|nr:hypothetical protein C8J57DRAFT_1384738 [Mycena rebaudengoi]
MFACNVTVSLLLAFSMISQVAGMGFKLQSVLNTAKCIAASSLMNGAPVFETPLPPDGFARLLSAGGVSSCLDVTDAQEWIFEDALSAIEWGGGLAIKGSKSSHQGSNHQQQLQVWKCGGNNNHQQFKKIPV